MKNKIKKLELNKLNVSSLNTQQLNNIAGAEDWGVVGMIWILNGASAAVEYAKLSQVILGLDTSFTYESAPSFGYELVD